MFSIVTRSSFTAGFAGAVASNPIDVVKVCMIMKVKLSCVSI